ncbi:MAG: methionyl-tRNA formyltransferase [Rickettsiales bacterium]|jgi:methionyl-tRNA formyltransferase|nr:methionyl-tRNA formyltransferase [Rickettsiales bacterium]
MKIILMSSAMGDSDWSMPVFEAIRANGHEVAAVYTRPESSAEIWANKHSIPVFVPKNFRAAEDVVAFQNLNADIALVAAYGVILPAAVLSAPKMGCINLHPSLLPKYRGASPFVSAIMNGDTESGVCLIKMGEGLDDGDIFICRKMSIGKDEQKSELKKRISEISTEMVLEYLSAPEKFPGVKQIGEPTMTRKITKEMLVADFSDPVRMHNMVRAYPVRARHSGVDLKITETRLNDGKLEVLRVHPAGKKEMDFSAFINGHKGSWE